MQILQMIALIIVLLFGAMYIAFKSPKLKMKEIVDDLSTGMKMREDIMEKLAEEVNKVSPEKYSELKTKLKVFEEFKALSTSNEKVIFDEKMEEVIVDFLTLANKCESLKDNFNFIDYMLKLKELETRIINTRFRYNGFVLKYNARRETALGKIFSKIYRFNKIESISISEDIKCVLTK